MADAAPDPPPAPTASDPRVLLARAVEAHKAGDRAAALMHYTALLAARPDSPLGWTNLGALFRAEGRHDRALAAQRRAHALDPGAATVRVNLANILDDTGAHGEAAELRRALAAERPEDREQAALLVRSLRAGGDLEAAMRAAGEGLARFPGDPEIQLQRAITELTAGDYAAGFADYQARWRTGALEMPKARVPRWTGAALDGARLLVLREQGFGDTLCFARFLPDLARFGGRVSVLSRPATVRLLQGAPGVERVIADRARRQDFDAWTSMMDLPEYHFRDGLPLPPPARLTLPADSVARARALLAPHAPGLKVGVCWTGSLTNDRNAMRSFGHRRLLPLADIAGVRLVSLYKGPELDAYRGDGTAAFIPDLCGADRDLADCAAVIAGLDLVITADTVTAHIAGSLGVEVWVLLHWEGFWLWGTDPARTPWYASMRLFRQQRPGDWEAVFQQVAAELAQRAARG